MVTNKVTTVANDKQYEAAFQSGQIGILLYSSAALRPFASSAEGKFEIGVAGYPAFKAGMLRRLPNSGAALDAICARGRAPRRFAEAARLSVAARDLQPLGARKRLHAARQGPARRPGDGRLCREFPYVKPVIDQMADTVPTATWGQTGALEAQTIVSNLVDALWAGEGTAAELVPDAVKRMNAAMGCNVTDAHGRDSSGGWDRAIRQQPGKRAAALAGSFVPFLYIAPMLLLLGLFVYWPLIAVLGLSGARWNLNPDMPMDFAGLENYARLIESPLFRDAMVNTAFYLLASIPLKILLPIPVAVAIWSLGRSGAIYRTILFMPTLISFVVISVVFLWLFNPIGGTAAADHRRASASAGQTRFLTRTPPSGPYCCFPPGRCWASMCSSIWRACHASASNSSKRCASTVRVRCGCHRPDLASAHADHLLRPGLDHHLHHAAGVHTHRYSDRGGTAQRHHEPVLHGLSAHLSFVRCGGRGGGNRASFRAALCRDRRQAEFPGTTGAL